MAEQTRSLEELIKELPPELHQEVADFIEFLQIRQTIKPRREKMRLTWEGGLVELRDQYTSVELQHAIGDMWDGEDASS